MIVGVDPGDYLRNFETDTLSVTFQGESYHIQPVVDAVQDLLQRTEAEFNRFYSGR